MGYRRFHAHRIKCDDCQKTVWEEIPQELLDRPFDETRLEFMHRLEKQGWKYYFGPAFEVHNCPKCHTFTPLNKSENNNNLW